MTIVLTSIIITVLLISIFFERGESVNIKIHENSGVHVHVIFRNAYRTVELNTSDVIRQAGLTASQFGILDILYSLGEMSINQIKQKFLATSGNLTVVLKNMERDGYIKRIQCPEDRRSYRFSITDIGREKIEEVLPKHRELIEDFYSIFNSDEKAQLIRLLKKFKQQAEKN